MEIRVATETAMPVLAVNPAAMVAPRVVALASAAVERTYRVQNKGDSATQFLPLLFKTMKNTNKKSNSRKQYPLIKVVWRDSNMYRFQDSIEYGLNNYSVESIVTVGFLLGFNKKDPIVTREIMNKGVDQRCTIVIPKENILSFTKIKGDYSDHWEWAEKRMLDIKNKLPPLEK